MSNTSVQYGVKKLIIINSGKYSYAELDLSGPVHLSAPNNRGKSTLVNALQFLYVDDLRVMQFGSRNLDDTKRHYFGNDPSYIVFECNTPLGPKCLLVSGQGQLNNCQFQRLVFDGNFNLKDFCNQNEELHSLDQIRPLLADRNLAEIKPGNLWEVLGNPKSSSADNGFLPRMNILPVRTPVEYRSFRDAFIRLLSMKNVSARELRELLIACHANNITCNKIDVAAEHREEFERAEQTEISLRFTKEIINFVEHGRQLRANLCEHTEQLSIKSKPISQEISNVLHQINNVSDSCNRKEETSLKTQEALSRKIENLNKQLGSIDTSIENQSRNIENLINTHNKWSVFTNDMIESMRSNLEHKQHTITRLSDHIRQASHQNIDALRRSTQSIKQDIESNKRTLGNWEKRSVNTLREMNISDEKIKQLFRIINPEIANLAIGQDITITETPRLQAKINNILNHIDGNEYTDSSIHIDLKKIAYTVDVTMKTREELQHDITTKEVELKNAIKQLEVAEDIAQANKKLSIEKNKYIDLSKKIQEYDEYLQDWADKPKLDSALKVLENDKQKTEDQIQSIRENIRELKDKIKIYNDRHKQCDEIKNTILNSVKEYNNLLPITLSDTSLINLDLSSHVDMDDNVQWNNVLNRSRLLNSQLEDMKKSASEIKRIERQLNDLQKHIIDESKLHRGQSVYFSDPDDDWKRLIDLTDSLPEQEEVVDKAWSFLFTRLTAKLSEIRRGVTEIDRAVKAINKGLANYRVSNLRSVQLEVVVQNETHDLIKTLTDAGGVFQDIDKIDHAKEQLRRWISSGKVIQLDELFVIHIKVHDMDRDRPTEAKSLDEIGSTGTGMTAKAMVFIQLVRASVSQDKYVLHFYMDETGQLDEKNLYATTRMAVDCGVIPITADPDVRIEPLAHPTVTVYSLGQNQGGKFYINAHRTCHGHRNPVALEESAT